MDLVTLGAALSSAKAYTDATIAPLLGGVHYRGSVNYFNNLPSNPAEGDAYTVKYSGSSGTSPDGTEYVWALDSDDNTYKWIGFSPDTYTKSEVDVLLSGKQDSIVFNTAYDATNNKAATMSDVPAAGSSTPQMDGTGSSGSATTYAKSDHVHPSDTSKQNEVLGSWTAGQATSHSTPVGTDTVLQALQKIDNNQRNDETNILSKPTRYIFDTGNASVAYLSKEVDITGVPNGMYMIVHTRFTSQTAKNGISVYMFYLLDGTIDNFTEVKAATGATISSISASNNVATIIYGESGFHEVTALYLYKN